MTSVDKMCCVLNCSRTRSDNTILHNFPNPDKEPDRFRTWLYAVGDNILALNNDTIFKYHKVCHCHFHPRFYTAGKRLCANAVPTLHLPEEMTPSVPSLLEEEKGPYSWQQDSTVVPCDDDDSDHCLPLATPEALDEVASVDELYDCEPPKCAPSALPSLVHEGYRCNVCCAEIVGFRYTCVQCADFDLCGACEARQAHAAHYMLRIPGPRPYSEIAAKLRTIRRALLSDAIVLVRGDTYDAPAEVKEEPLQEDPIHVDHHADSLAVRETEHGLNPPSREPSTPEHDPNVHGPSITDRAQTQMSPVPCKSPVAKIKSYSRLSTLNTTSPQPPALQHGGFAFKTIVNINQSNIIKPVPILMRNKEAQKDAGFQQGNVAMQPLNPPKRRICLTVRTTPEQRASSSPLDSRKKIKKQDGVVGTSNYLQHLTKARVRLQRLSAAHMAASRRAPTADPTEQHTSDRP